MNAYDVLHVIGFRSAHAAALPHRGRRRRAHPGDGPCILTPNHESIVDPFILAVATTRPIHYMGKAELFRYRPVAALLRSLNTFPVERGAATRPP